MSEAMPSFMLSPYFYYDENGNGTLRAGAPVEIITAFEEWYNADNTEEWSAGSNPEQIALTLDDLKDL